MQWALQVGREVSVTGEGQQEQGPRPLTHVPPLILSLADSDPYTDDVALPTATRGTQMVHASRGSRKKASKSATMCFLASQRNLSKWATKMTFIANTCGYGTKIKNNK